MTREPSRCVASLLLFAALPVQDNQSWILEVDAGAHARRDVLVECALPPELAVGQRIAADPPRFVWRVPGELAAGEVRRYELLVEPAVDPDSYRVQVGGGERKLLHGERELVRYHAALVAPPEGVDPVYTRGGYLHPLLTPSGRAVTGDFPPAHLHHHGVWTAWTRTRFEGRAIDFWNSAERQGRVGPVEVLHAAGGAYLAHLRLALRHVDTTAPKGERVALHETWDVRAFALDDATVVDLELEQRCASASPLELLEYHYGGLGWRGPVGWEGDACRFLTSAGKDRLEGHATRARWCAITGDVEGQPVTAAILCHPSNPRAPQPMRLHPSEPFFCYAPEQLGPFEITPDEPYRARYRLLAMDGEPDIERIEELWRDWAEPPVARIVER